MNPQIFSFGLFLLWSGIAFAMLVIVPAYYPKFAGDLSRQIFMGVGAAMLALWNLVRWWSIRGFLKTQRTRAKEEHQRRQTTAESKEPKPILNPEFQFDEPTRIPPAPPPNGKKSP